MAIAKVQGLVVSFGTTSITTSFPNTPTEGNLLIVWSSYTSGAGPAISGFTEAISAIEGSGGYIGIWYKVAGASESKDVVATNADGTAGLLDIEEWSGISSPTLDKTAKTDDTGGTVSSRSSGTTATTTANDELAVAGVAFGSYTSAQSWSNSFTDERSADTETNACGSKILSATAAIETTLSWTTARRAGGCIATFMAGGTAYTQAVSGAITPGGTIVNRAGKALSGALTSAGVLINRTGKSLAGMLTPAGVVVKQTGKVLSGGITPSGVIGAVKTALVSLAGALTPAGALVLRTGKSLAGVLTPVGPTAWVKDVFMSMAGMLTPAGVVVKQTGKPLSGGITPSGVIGAVKTALVSLAGALTPAGAVVLRTGKSLAGSLTPDGGLVRSVGKILAGALTSAGTVVKQTGKILAGVLDSAGDLVTTYIPAGGILYFQAASGALTSAGAVVLRTSKVLAGALTPTGTVKKLMQLARTVLAGGLTPTGIVAAVWGWIAPITSRRIFHVPEDSRTHKPPKRYGADVDSGDRTHKP